MNPGVFDAEAVGKRRRELFPVDDRAPYDAAGQPKWRGGTQKAHCEYCPVPEGQDCVKVCVVEREAQAAKDGVKIS